MNEEFVYLNPFLTNAVHESEIWAEEATGFADVESIHAEVSEVLRRDLRTVATHPQHPTRVRFLVGHSGAGKSHLFSRLRRQIGGEAIFAFASNPPTRPAALFRWTLDKIVYGLRRPRVVASAPKPYSQLEALLYRLLLTHDPVFVEADPEGLHEVWSDVSEGEREEYLRTVEQRLVARGYQAPLLRGMLGVFRPETREVAFRWLSGSTNLMVEELQAIGQAQPIEDAEVDALLCLMGDLSHAAATPIVLVLDQLDLMVEPAHIDELQRLLLTLIDQSQNWYVVIGLIQDKFELWSTRLNQALRTRFQGMGGGRLPVTELPQIADAAQKTALLRQRLSSAPLITLRAEEGIASEVYPLGDGDIDSLVSGATDLPRALLARACAVYQKRTEAGARPVESLGARMHSEFEERRARIDPETMSVDKASIADRLREAIELAALANGLGPVDARVGPLEQEGPSQGTDAIVTVGGRPLRILAHHVPQGPAFPRFLSRVLGLPWGTVLVRDGAVPISGQVTTQRLEEFRKDKQFLHLPRPAIADLFALGEVLAELREGNFGTLPTDPVPTPDNVKAALSQQGWFQQHAFTRAVLASLSPEANPSRSRPPTPRHRPRTFQPLSRTSFGPRDGWCWSACACNWSAGIESISPPPTSAQHSSYRLSTGSYFVTRNKSWCQATCKSWSGTRTSMLKPALLSIEIGPELRRRIEPAVFRPLFEEASRAGTRSLSITQAKELLAIAVPQYREMVSGAAPALAGIGPVPLRNVGTLLHQALQEAARFFRREGAYLPRRPKTGHLRGTGCAPVARTLFATTSSLAAGLWEAGRARNARIPRRGRRKRQAVGAGPGPAVGTKG
ncbi:MAG: hypothetical protein ACREXM_05080 [Gammaproteobacteria bacterium]